MHICFNSLDYPSALGCSGVGNQVWLLARALLEAGHKVSVIDLAQKGLPAVSDDDGVRVYRVPCGNLHWYLSRIPLLGLWLSQPVRQLERSWAAWRQIRRVHRTEPIDLIEGTETDMLLVALWLPFIPFLVRLHGEPYTFRKYTPGMKLTIGLRLCRILQRAALRRARLLISPSKAHGREIGRELGRRCPPIEVVPNMLSHELVEAGMPDRTDAGRGANHLSETIPGRVVLYVGRLEPNKGVPTLLAAARRVLADTPDAYLVLAGSNHPSLPAAEQERLLSQLPCRERVHLLGHVPWRDLFAWYRKAAVCVLPSHYETFGLAALEPMAFGAPVVATTAGGLPEIIDNEESGLLVPPGDEDALARALTRLLGDAELRRRLGEGGRRAAARYTRIAHMDANMGLFRWTKGGRCAERIFFSPHLDDAALSCSGLIHAAARRGERVRVVTVFAGAALRGRLSAFARHLHRKWDLTVPVPARREEDRKALGALGVERIEHWDFLEAPYRHDESGRPLYSTYEALKGAPSAADTPLVDELFRGIEGEFSEAAGERQLYFPLALGGHVDHRVLFQVGLRLRAAGWDVRFYEDWPYADAYEAAPDGMGWLSETVEVDLVVKLSAVLEYHSQLPGLGNSRAVLRARLARYAKRVGKGRPRERYWHLTPSRVGQTAGGDVNLLGIPFVLKKGPPIRPRIEFLRRGFRRQGLERILPPGSGLCVVLGGADAHRSVIERGGYSCLPRVIPGPDAPGEEAGRPGWDTLPLESAAAVVACPAGDALNGSDRAVVESYRVLEPGGVFCGSVFPAEWDAASPCSVERLLRGQGFQDVAVSGSMGGLLGRLRRCVARLFGRPEDSPAEGWGRPAMQDQIVFSARKPAREARCTSAS